MERATVRRRVKSTRAVPFVVRRSRMRPNSLGADGSTNVCVCQIAPQGAGKNRGRSLRSPRRRLAPDELVVLTPPTRDGELVWARCAESMFR